MLTKNIISKQPHKINNSLIYMFFCLNFVGISKPLRCPEIFLSNDMTNNDQKDMTAVDDLIQQLCVEI